MKSGMPGGMGAAILAGTVLLAFAGAHARRRRPEARADGARFTAQGQMVRPADYREWIYLSSGLGMQYGLAAGQPQKFTNVFVEPAAWRQFVSTGHWPEGAVFVVEERASSSRGSINKTGHYQTDLVGLGVEVKDAARFPDRWAYFFFEPTDQTAGAQPKSACWQCHEEHGAVEHTFVQFYPTLAPIARKFHTYNERRAARP